MIITICSIKGGTGKSMIAQNMAVYWANRGYKTVLIDGDSDQYASWNWYQERATRREEIEPYLTPLLAVIPWYNNIEFETYKLPKPDIVILECGAGQQKFLSSCLNICDLAIFPFSPSRRDLNSFLFTHSLMNYALKKNPKGIFRGLINKAYWESYYSYLNFEAKDAFESSGFEVLKNMLYRRPAYDLSEELGLSIWDDIKTRSCRRLQAEFELVMDEIISLGVNKLWV